ncbi:hypothetical protein PanWU01x14_165450, partial [Parasponia andersonii]
MGVMSPFWASHFFDDMSAERVRRRETPAPAPAPARALLSQESSVPRMATTMPCIPLPAAAAVAEAEAGHSCSGFMNDVVDGDPKLFLREPDMFFLLNKKEEEELLLSAAKEQFNNNNQINMK